MKRCGMCWAHLPASEFYRNDEMADGLFSVCKACHRQRVAANRRLKRKYYQEKDRKRDACRVRERYAAVIPN